MTRQVWSVGLKGGQTVIMQVLTPSEVINAAKLASSNAALATAESGAKMSIVEVDGVEVTWEQLVGGKWGELFPRTRTKMQLVKTWNRIHGPDRAQEKAVLANMSPTLAADGMELWTVTLPSMKVAVLKEPGLETIGEVLERLKGKTSSPIAEQLLFSMDSVRRSLVSVDGKPVDQEALASEAAWDELFGVVDTILLGAAWQEAFDGGGEEVTLGEARPVSGT